MPVSRHVFGSCYDGHMRHMLCSRRIRQLLLSRLPVLRTRRPAGGRWLLGQAGRQPLTLSELLRPSKSVGPVCCEQHHILERLPPPARLWPPPTPPLRPCVWTRTARQVWLLNLVCISFYASVFVFLQNGTQFLQQARRYLSLCPCLSVCLCPAPMPKGSCPTQAAQGPPEVSVLRSCPRQPPLCPSTGQGSR